MPQFADLQPAAEERLRKLISESDLMGAMRELRDTTGCSIEQAKAWVQHDGRAKPRAEGTSCPYCGGLLRTRLAKQCVVCGMDWHDPDHARRPGC